MALVRSVGRQMLGLVPPQPRQTIIHLRKLLARERKHGRRAGLSLARRTALWRQGFLSESAVLYGADAEAGLDDYLSDYARMQRSFRINAPFSLVLQNKLYFWGLLRQFSDRICPVLGLVRGGRLVRFGAPGTLPLVEGLAGLGERLVVKPCLSSGGSGVTLIERRAGVLLANGAPVEAPALERLVGADLQVVVPFIEQAAYARAIFPGSANSIRILTMFEEEANEAFIAAAVHRFGTTVAGAPVDNWSRGGLSAWIDKDTGELGRAYRFRDGELSAHDSHPDTGAAIAGTTVPGWPALRRAILDLASQVPFLPYVGWDVVLTDGGFVILEGNNRSDVNLIQVHRPLLSDPRVRRFYRRHGVI